MLDMEACFLVQGENISKVLLVGSNLLILGPYCCPVLEMSGGFCRKQDFRCKESWTLLFSLLFGLALLGTECDVFDLVRQSHRL